MQKLQQLIKTDEDFDFFVNLLINKVKSNEIISDNGLLDGFIISAIYSKELIVRDLFFPKIGVFDNVSERALQLLKQIVIWLTNNEETLCKMYKHINY